MKWRCGAGKIVTEKFSFARSSLSAVADFIRTHTADDTALVVVGIPVQIVRGPGGPQVARKQSKYHAFAEFEGGDVAAIERYLGGECGRPVCVRQDGFLSGLGKVEVGDVEPGEIAYSVDLGTSVAGSVTVHPGHLELPASVRISHFPFDPAGGQCDCGNHGCVKTFLSRAVLENLAEDFGLPGDLAKVTELGSTRNQSALEFYGEVGGRLARLFAAVASILPVHAFILGGGIGKGAGELLRRPAQERLRRGGLLDAEVAAGIDVRTTKSKNAVLDGARYLARQFAAKL